jgi:hypothetical protein
MSALQEAARAADATVGASGLQLIGAFFFGVVVGWFTYFVNRHRTEEVKLADVASLVAAIGGGAVLALFPAGTDLFGAYGLGLAVGFFAYLLVLVVLVATQSGKGWTFEYFLDGRAPKLPAQQQQSPGHPLGTDENVLK